MSASFIARLLKVAAIASVATLVACSPQADRPAKPHTLVTVQTAEFEPYARKQILTGSIAARAETPAAFLVGGRLTTLTVDVGDRVRKNQVLASLSPVEQQADVDAARAALGAAEAQLNQAKTSLDRQTALLDQGLTTRSSHDGARTAWETAGNARDSAQAQLDLAEEALSYAELKAPADGVVTRRLVQADEVVQAGAPVLIIAEDGPRQAVINVQETAIAGWDRQSPVNVALVSDPSVVATGLVSEVAPALDATGTVQVKIAIETDMPLGAPVSVVLERSAEQRIVLPAQALWSSGKQAAVWVVAADQSVSLVPVTIDHYDTGAIVVSAGLEAGQTVVTGGTQFLFPGQLVDIQSGAQS